MKRVGTPGFEVFWKLSGTVKLFAYASCRPGNNSPFVALAMIDLVLRISSSFVFR